MRSGRSYGKKGDFMNRWGSLVLMLVVGSAAMAAADDYTFPKERSTRLGVYGGFHTGGREATMGAAALGMAEIAINPYLGVALQGGTLWEPVEHTTLVDGRFKLVSV